MGPRRIQEYSRIRNKLFKCLKNKGNIQIFKEYVCMKITVSESSNTLPTKTLFLDKIPRTPSCFFTGCYNIIPIY